MVDHLDELLGVDTNDPVQGLAQQLVDEHDSLLRRLVSLRKKHGLTQAEVGERMGVTQPAVAAFERVDADPRLSTVRRYALAVGARITHAVDAVLPSNLSRVEYSVAQPVAGHSCQVAAVTGFTVTSSSRASLVGRL